MQHPGWVLVIIGVVIAGIGAIWLLAPHIPWLRKLPGDIAVEGKNFRSYFPIVTCIVLSLLLTGIMWLVRLLSRRAMTTDDASYALACGEPKVGQRSNEKRPSEV